MTLTPVNRALAWAASTHLRLWCRKLWLLHRSHTTPPHRWRTAPRSPRSVTHTHTHTHTHARTRAHTHTHTHTHMLVFVKSGDMGQCPHKSHFPCNTCHTCVIIQIYVLICHKNARAHTHVVLPCFIWKFHRCNGFYTVQTVFSKALHLNLPLTANLLHF